jgi:hypothetical protein
MDVIIVRDVTVMDQKTAFRVRRLTLITGSIREIMHTSGWRAL